VSTSTTSAFLNRLRQTLKPSLAPTDGQLLESFVNQGDPAAFESLVVRHGPMVLGVCRRLLRHEADVADAFQATFLVLVRRASSIRPRGMVGNWLHGVARNTARKARAMSRRALPVESERVDPSLDPEELLDRKLLHAILDEELTRLPDIYRAAIVLCELEGKTIKQTARELGCPQGTVATRLSRGRALLAKRLTARGLAVSATTLPSLLAPGFLGAAVPGELLNFTCQSVLSGATSAPVTTLAKGVLTTMLLKKLKLITAFVVAGLICVGIGLVGKSEMVAQVPPAKANPLPAPTPAPVPEKETPKKDADHRAFPKRFGPTYGQSTAFIKLDGTSFKIRAQMPIFGFIKLTDADGKPVHITRFAPAQPEPFTVEAKDLRFYDVLGKRKNPKEVETLFKEERFVLVEFREGEIDPKQVAEAYSIYREDMPVVFIDAKVFPTIDRSKDFPEVKSLPQAFPSAIPPKPEYGIKEPKR
jgi:RNA polymerase sigma factor (sigma-70 family)